MKNRTLLLGLVLVFAATAVVGCGSKVTKENAAKVKVGMTVEEVKGILGEPTEEPSASVTVGDVKLGASMMVWKDGDKVITVTVADGKVATVVTNGL